MNRHDLPYDADVNADPLRADEPAYEEGPVVAGDGGSVFGRLRELRARRLAGGPEASGGPEAPSGPFSRSSSPEAGFEPEYRDAAEMEGASEAAPQAGSEAGPAPAPKARFEAEPASGPAFEAVRPAPAEGLSVGAAPAQRMDAPEASELALGAAAPASEASYLAPGAVELAPGGAAPTPAAAALNAAAYLLSLVGLFLAVLALEVVGFLIGAIAVGALSEAPAFPALTEDDELMLVDIIIQLVWLAVMVPWWLHLRRRGIGIDRRPAARDTAPARVVATVMLGVGLQIVISIALTYILPLFPEVMESYESMMDDSGTSTLSPLGVVSVAVLAPVVEEITFRGIAYQFALRAVCPGWQARAGYGEPARMSALRARFWVANALQALAFGIMHLNITQGVYAFAIGLVCGWLFWRTGRLRWSMGLHATLNFCSYFVSEILDACGLWGLISPWGEYVMPVVLTVWGIRLFARASEETALG